MFFAKTTFVGVSFLSDEDRCRTRNLSTYVGTQSKFIAAFIGILTFVDYLMPKPSLSMEREFTPFSGVLLRKRMP